MVGIECRQTEHSLAAKTTWKKGQRYVEKKATLHGELANTTWSVGKGSVPRRFLRHAGGKNPVVFFREDSSHGNHRNNGKEFCSGGFVIRPLVPSPPVLAGLSSGLSCLRLPFWRICNPTGQKESICNAVNDRRDC